MNIIRFGMWAEGGAGEGGGEGHNREFLLFYRM